MNVQPISQPGPLDRSAVRFRDRWPFSLILGTGIALVYLANGREIGAFDTIPTMLLPLAIVRGDGLHLDRFRALLQVWGKPLPMFVSQSAGHIVSCYPVGPALVALPLIAPQVMAIDRAEPGWDRNKNRVYLETRVMAKRAAAILTAVLAFALHRLLVRLGLARVAIPAVIATALGSDLWSVASQALWQHGPAALALTLTMLVSDPVSMSRSRMLFLGTAAAVLVLCRPLDLIFAVFILAWATWTHSRLVGWFLPAPVILGLALLGYHQYYFNGMTGGQDQLEAQHRRLHAVGGPWSGDLAAGMAGTLVSPSRGLFVFSPWIALAIAVLPASFRKIAPGSLVRWLCVAMIPYLFVLSKYAVWWGGGCFGPRYWTDAAPIFGVILAAALDWAGDRSRLLIIAMAVAILISAAIQTIGAFCFPSSWIFYPTDIDIDHQRLWDWRDTEISRCIKESILRQPSPLVEPRQ